MPKRTYRSTSPAKVGAAQLAAEEAALPIWHSLSPKLRYELHSGGASTINDGKRILIRLGLLESRKSDVGGMFGSTYYSLHLTAFGEFISSTGRAYERALAEEEAS